MSFAARSSPLLDRERVRIEYLAELAGVPAADVERLCHRYTSIQYAGPEELNREIEQALFRQQEDIRTLLQKIADRGVALAPSATMKIVPSITDMRQKAVGPLPVPVTREITFR